MECYRRLRTVIDAPCTDVWPPRERSRRSLRASRHGQHSYHITAHAHTHTLARNGADLETVRVYLGGLDCKTLAFHHHRVSPHPTPWHDENPSRRQRSVPAFPPFCKRFYRLLAFSLTRPRPPARPAGPNITPVHEPRVHASLGAPTGKTGC